MSATAKCSDPDLTEAEHTRCSGVVPDAEWWRDGTPCDCACHSAERCYDVYTGNNGTVMFCRLHAGHGGNFHREPLKGGGDVMWSVRP